MKTVRTRTIFFACGRRKNESGKIVSALYGKIHGEIGYSWTRGIRFIYYLNPTPNDRNLEFDPSRNLFTDLKPMEQVREP